MIILGIDPGVERIGIAILSGTSHSNTTCITSDTFITQKKDTPQERILQIYTQLKKLCIQYRPNCLMMEQLLFAKNVKTAVVVAQVQGVILLLASELHIELKVVNPMSVKSAVAGDGNADKLAMKKMVDLQIELPKKKRLDDEYDAIACAYSYFLS